MDKIQAYLLNLVGMGYTELDATLYFLQDENIKPKYKNIYLDSIPNYVPPVPMEIDVELEPQNFTNPMELDLELDVEPPKRNPVLRRY